MTTDIIILFIILAGAVLLFITEWLRVDLVAMIVLGALVIAGLVAPDQALDGFSSPAVVTVWAIFILSGALARTGVAGQIGGVVMRLSGNSEARLIVVIMALSGFLSAFMNNTGVAALFLPVILDISRQLRIAPSKLLLPMVVSTLLGGMTTLISTPSNILVSSALVESGLAPLTLFDFTPAGVLLLVVGIAFMVLIGRFLLPSHRAADALTNEQHSTDLYALDERLGVIGVPADSPLIGMTLAESYIGRFLGIIILVVQRADKRQAAPEPEMALQAGDRLLVLGQLQRLEAIRQSPPLIVAPQAAALETLLEAGIELGEFRLAPDAPLVGQTLMQADVRRRYDVNVVALSRGRNLRHMGLQQIMLQAGDRLLVAGRAAQLAALGDVPGIAPVPMDDTGRLLLAERLLTLQVAKSFVGDTLVETNLGSTFGLVVLGLMRDGDVVLLPGPKTPLQAGDTLIVEGPPRGLNVLRGLQTLTVEPAGEIDSAEIERLLESDTVGLMQAVLSPYTRLLNKTLREINFREKYGLSVLAIWRGGRPYRSNLGDLPLEFGDALLLHGPRTQFPILGHDPDFLVLQADAQEPPRRHKAPIAAAIMIGVVVVAIAGWLPIAISALIGATLTVLTGCLDMDEAYRFIEWKAVFLIACMLPLGVAMDQTGAANLVAEGVVGALGGLGPHALLGGMFLLGLAATQFMPNPVVAVLLSPIAISAALGLGISAYPFALTIAYASSSSFLTPVGHAANVLVMGPGGYRFNDYVKVGVPLALVLLVVTVIAVPIFFPF